QIQRRARRSGDDSPGLGETGWPRRWGCDQPRLTDKRRCSQRGRCGPWAGRGAGPAPKASWGAWRTLEIVPESDRLRWQEAFIAWTWVHCQLQEYYPGSQGCFKPETGHFLRIFAIGDDWNYDGVPRRNLRQDG